LGSRRRRLLYRVQIEVCPSANVLALMRLHERVDGLTMAARQRCVVWINEIPQPYRPWFTV
ncbi:MAG: hypothetical protein KDK08_16355, partial [Rhizobiaceae bacterium]|nr:hypothetical protein [Rhizobiaceae bacterium]